MVRDKALRHFCAQVARDVRVRKIEPQAPQVRAAEDGFRGGPSPKKKVKKEYESGGGWQQQRNVQPLVGGGCCAWAAPWPAKVFNLCRELFARLRPLFEV